MVQLVYRKYVLHKQEERIYSQEVKERETGREGKTVVSKYYAKSKYQVEALFIFSYMIRNDTLIQLLRIHLANLI